MLNVALVRVAALFWAIWLCENDITLNNKLIITLGAKIFMHVIYCSIHNGQDLLFP